jgi:hypothetical protein
VSRVRTIPEITVQGTRALVRALGYPDAVRFIAALRPGRGDYAKDRRTLLKGVSVEDVLAEVRQAQGTQAPAKRQGTRRKRSA